MRVQSNSAPVTARRPLRAVHGCATAAACAFYRHSALPDPMSYIAKNDWWLHPSCVLVAASDAVR